MKQKPWARRHLIGFTLLLLVMAIAVLGNAAVARAESEDHDHNHTGWSEWTDATALPTTSGSYFLTTDVSLSDTWTVEEGKDISICLNGHAITENADKPAIKVLGTLSIYDEPGDGGTITHGDTYGGCGVYIGDTLNTQSNTCVFNLYGGTIAGNSRSGDKGGGIYVCGIANCTLNMYGGVIANNSATYGGGVSLDTPSGSWTRSFNMYGGTICDNTATSYGGGVYAVYGTSFNMYGGDISNNEAGADGGGVYLGSNYFTMSDASITNNVIGEDGHGGGVFASSVDITMSGKVLVTNNTAGTGDSATANNVWLRRIYDKIIIDGPLDSESRIGVLFSESLPVGSGDEEVSEIDFTSGYGTYNSGLDPSEIFSADRLTEYVFGRDGEAYLTHHKHNFYYTKSQKDATITASCTALPCPDNYGGGDDGMPITLTLVAPEDLAYDGNPKEATIVGYPESPVDRLADKPTPVYYASTGEGSTTSTGDAIDAPTEVGDYVVKMTWGKEYNTLTVSVAFSIEAKTYMVSMAETTNGIVSLSTDMAQAGDTVMVSYVAEEDYELASFVVEDALGNPVEVKDGAFIMPASDVTIIATFVQKTHVPSGQHHVQPHGNLFAKLLGRSALFGTIGKLNQHKAIARWLLPNSYFAWYRAHSEWLV